MPSSIVNFLETPESMSSTSSKDVAPNTKNEIAGAALLIPKKILTKTTKRSGGSIAKSSDAKISCYNSASRSSLVQAAAGLLLIAKTKHRVPAQAANVSDAAGDNDGKSCSNQFAKLNDLKMGTIDSSQGCDKLSRSKNCLESLIEITELDRKFMLYQPSSQPARESYVSSPEFKSLAGSRFMMKRKCPIKQRADKKSKKNAEDTSSLEVNPQPASVGSIAGVMEAAQSIRDNKMISQEKYSKYQSGYLHLRTPSSTDNDKSSLASLLPDGILSKMDASVDPRATFTSTPGTAVNRRIKSEVPRKAEQTIDPANTVTTRHPVNSKHRLDLMTYKAISAELNDLKSSKESPSNRVDQVMSAHISVSKHLKLDSKSIHRNIVKQLNPMRPGVVSTEIGESNHAACISRTRHGAIEDTAQGNDLAPTNRVQANFRFPLPANRRTHETDIRELNFGSRISDIQHEAVGNALQTKNASHTNTVPAKKPAPRFAFSTKNSVQTSRSVQMEKNQFRLNCLPSKDGTINGGSTPDPSASKLQHRKSEAKWPTKGEENLTPEEERERIRAYRCASTARHRARKKEHRAEMLESIDFYRSALGMPPRPATPPRNKSRAGLKRPNYDPPAEQMALMTAEEVSEWKRVQRMKRKREKTADLVKQENEKLLNLAAEHAQLKQLYKNSVATSDEE